MDKYLKSIKKIFNEFSESKYGAEKAAVLWKETERIYREFISETPSIGGRKNIMAHNLYEMLVFFAFYEACGRSLDGNDIEELTNLYLKKFKSMGRFINLNRLVNIERKIIYKLISLYKKKVDRYKGGEWNNTWGVEINPENHKTGIALTLVGCPIADFAKKHGYEDIMPYFCNVDHLAAQMLHGRLIRKHTVAQGYDSCDYWIVGDKEDDKI